MPNVHVVPSGDQWKVEVEGGAQALSTFDNQEVAITSGTMLAKRLQVELIVHGKDGAIRMRNSYGNDPRDVKG
ncbi:DUF2188 domain-containing protein (plasmid) [Cupriavidus necator]|uniref:DUF2188 domain-containing protein n=1 Tax=Cupriavidus necator TaxID=106590 RepID=UPI003F731659